MPPLEDRIERPLAILPTRVGELPTATRVSYVDSETTLASIRATRFVFCLARGYGSGNASLAAAASTI